MKPCNYAKSSKILVLQSFMDIEKARWVRIKTIVLIWCGRGDLNPHSLETAPKTVVSAIPPRPHMTYYE